MQTHLYKNDLDDGIVFKGNVAIDTEAMGLDPARDRLCLIQIFDGETDCHMVQFENSNTDSPNLIKLLNDEKIEKIFHYARFDMAALKHALKIDVKNVYCTKIASKIARTYTNNHGLKDLCKELLGVEISKKQQSSDWGNSNLSKEQIAYAANDVIYLHQIKDRLDEMLIRENRQLLVDACLSFLPTRVDLDLRGWENDIFSHSS
ncbi:MAG: ribonuclease D [Pelagibacteraceae bacterium TMED258]|jgi:ribonuclease D|nr:MAG: ribonuclease D [Pelagibacteraceae bacterium TMED258]|tara:strand:+ start:258 stop:872 length:615 start_codon:yes stop_codon:yes gene_type:complete